MANAEPNTGVAADLVPLLRIAAGLRDLPREDFRRRLGDELQAAPPAARAPELASVDLGELLRQIPTLVIGDATSEAEANDAVREVGWLGDRMLGVMRFSGQTPWERHPDGDELLHVLEGQVDITVLTETGATLISAGAGSVFVCPQGLWHRQYARESVTILFGTQVRTSEISDLEDPRVESGRP